MKTTRPPLDKMQSVFIGQRRGAGLLRLTEKIGRRDGELKTYWTEPLHYGAPMGIELFVSSRESFWQPAEYRGQPCEQADTGSKAEPVE
jgi:hypothetical protein